MTTELATQQTTLRERAGSIVVTDDASLTAAANIRSEAKALIRQVTETFKPIKQAQDEAKRQTLAQERSYLDPLQAIVETIDEQIKDYQREQARKAREEQARLQREAEARARAEREAAEQKAREEQAATAAMLEDAGQAMEADAVRAEPIVIEAPRVEVARYVPPPVVPKAAPIQLRETWSAELTDILALCRWQIAHPTIVLVQADMTKLNQMARLGKSGASAPDGVRFFPTQSVAEKRAR